MKLYIDFFTVISQPGNKKFHGGGNYARNIIYELLKDREELDIVILCPMGYKPSEENEPIFYKHKKIIWEETKQITNYYKFDERSILWSPTLSRLEDFKSLIAIKKTNPNLKVCATVHDLRTLYFVWDTTEKYYFSGIKKLFFPLYKICFEGIAIHLFKKPVIKKCLSSIDQIFTVSNFAMQDIIKLNSKTKVSWYYQSSMFNYLKCESKENSEQYLLFVSGGRRLKNLGHALIGFSLFKKKCPENSLKLVVTGISNDIFENICKIPGISREIVKSDVIRYEYVNPQKLGDLYANCRFALYTSKMEGFGLPVVEAAIFGKTSIVSNVTAIPEVMGSSVRYVYPQDDYAIAYEIEYLCDDNNLRKYEKRVKTVIPILKNRMDLEQKNFIGDLLET